MNLFNICLDEKQLNFNQKNNYPSLSITNVSDPRQQNNFTSANISSLNNSVEFGLSKEYEIYHSNIDLVNSPIIIDYSFVVHIVIENRSSG